LVREENDHSGISRDQYSIKWSIGAGDIVSALCTWGD